MKLLDLFCGAGGAAMGYHRAGFEVVGVDIHPQKNYPFEFVQADAMTFPLDGFDVIHASPPCQRYSALNRGLGNTDEKPDLLSATRNRLESSGVQWVLENVIGSPMGAVLLCGSMFGLNVRRHRLFESTVFIWGQQCRHSVYPTPIDVSGTGSFQHSPRKTKTGGKGRKPKSLDEARALMDMEWSDRRGISQAIPPAYTEYIGRQIMAALTTPEPGR